MNRDDTDKELAYHIGRLGGLLDHGNPLVLKYHLEMIDACIADPTTFEQAMIDDPTSAPLLSGLARLERQGQPVEVQRALATRYRNMALVYDRIAGEATDPVRAEFSRYMAAESNRLAAHADAASERLAGEV